MRSRNSEMESASSAGEIERHEGCVPFDPSQIFPRNNTERINLMIHFHRAEIARMAGWRDRIDRTTNWAITVVAASLSYSFSSASVSHVTLIACMVMVLFLLVIEARRYRFFDVFRCRVRCLERNYYAGFMSVDPQPDGSWLERLGEDLRNPTFKMKLADAMRRRLRRNYIGLLLIVLLAWALKIGAVASNINPSTDLLVRFVDAASVGAVGGEFVIVATAVLYASLFALMIIPGFRAEHLPSGGVNV